MPRKVNKKTGKVMKFPYTKAGKAKATAYAKKQKKKKKQCQKENQVSAYPRLLKAKQLEPAGNANQNYSPFEHPCMHGSQLSSL